MKKCKDEAAADDDARAMIEHGLDQDDQQEGDISAMEVQMIWISRNKGVTSVFFCCFPLPRCMTNRRAAKSPPIQSIICCVVQC